MLAKGSVHVLMFLVGTEMAAVEYSGTSAFLGVRFPWHHQVEPNVTLTKTARPPGVLAV